MNKEEQMLCSHLADLAQACSRRNYPVGSDFLSLSEQSTFLAYAGQHRLPVDFSMTGGYEDAERKIIYFEPVGAGFQVAAPLSLLALQPKENRFTQPVGHRDYLGAAVGLGLNRSKIGDIVMQDKGAYMICEDTIADFICDNLKKVRNSDVECKRVPWQDFKYEPKVKEINASVASVRLDAIVAAAFSKSRSSITGLIEEGKVFINGKAASGCSQSLKDGELVSVRGLGKFRYVGTSGISKKGRTYVKLELFI